MGRYLFVVPPFIAHVNPTASLGIELSRRGHEVAWVTYEGMRRLLPEGARVFELPRTISEEDAEALRGRLRGWMEGVKVLWGDVIIPLARAMLPAVESAIEAFGPDVVVVDQQAVAGGLAARRAGLPWATSAASGQLVSEAFATLPPVRRWVVEQLAGLQREAGLEPVEWPDCSPDLVLLYTTPALAGERAETPASYRFVGPLLEGRPERDDFPWDELRACRRVFVSLGSIVAERGERFFCALAEALGRADVQVIAVAPPSLLTEWPSNFIVRAWVPQLALLPRVDAVVSHGGSTVNEVLAFGKPLVIAPMVNDNFVFADKVVQAGAGVRVKFARATASELRDAVFDVLETASYREAAERIMRSFRDAGGVRSAAEALEALDGASR